MEPTTHVVYLTSDDVVRILACLQLELNPEDKLITKFKEQLQ